MPAESVFVTNALTTDYLFDSLIEESDDHFYEPASSATDTLPAATDLLISVEQLSLLYSSTALEPLSAIEPDSIETQDIGSDFIEIQDADDTLLLDFNPPGSGDSNAIATDALGAFYSGDPIEYGDPFTDAYYWRKQEGSASCAVVAQICVYQSLTGQYISETTASNYAYQQNWFDPVTGTTLENTGKILNAFGIQTYQQWNASLSTLEYALAQGDKPIVGLDASEIWNPQYDWFGNPFEQANEGHAVWVTGIDYEWDGSINIIVNDSGISSGQSSVIDYYDFMNAWNDYSNFVCVADNPFV